MGRGSKASWIAMRALPIIKALGQGWCTQGCTLPCGAHCYYGAERIAGLKLAA
jgi:hypothetical protein